jgi:broad specificity phosphatase PhoE
VIATTVFLARHGQSLWNRCKRVTGQLNPELAPEGRAQARDLAELLRDVPLSAVFASDLVRSRETARLVAETQGHEVQEMPALRELHFGTLQGRFRDARDPEVEALWRARKADPVSFRAPGGETFAELTSRVGPAVREILAVHPDGTVLIVGHRNTNRAILATLLGWTPEVAVTAPIQHDCLYRVRVGDPPEVSATRFSTRIAPAEAVRS